MPDLFKGSPADPDWFPTDTEEKARALEGFKPKAYNATLIPTIIRAGADAKLRWPSVQAWGCFGLGWGGKVRIILVPSQPYSSIVPDTLSLFQLVAQASGTGTPFKVSGQAYPS